jgi:hypothetical protein
MLSRYGRKEAARKRNNSSEARAMKQAFAVGFLMILLASSGLRAQELRIGHLEATDDPGGIDWAFFHCEQSSQILECDVFQTLIHHELSADQRAEYIDKSMQDGPTEQFTDKQFCGGIAAAKRGFEDAIKTGKGADGRPVSQRQAHEGLLIFDAVDQACRSPNLNTARRAFEVMADQKTRTCKVLNDYSHTRFTWNAPTQSWVFQSGPSGPCGTVIVGTLERDKNANGSASRLATTIGAAGFWLYIERHIFTNRNGVFPNGLSCNKFPDTTLHYTWQAALNYSGSSWNRVGEFRV